MKLYIETLNHKIYNVVSMWCGCDEEYPLSSGSNCYYKNPKLNKEYLDALENDIFKKDLKNIKLWRFEAWDRKRVLSYSDILSYWTEE